MILLNLVLNLMAYIAQMGISILALVLGIVILLIWLAAVGLVVIPPILILALLFAS
jgi:hypothetical protein